MDSENKEKNLSEILGGRYFISTRPEGRSAALKKEFKRFGADLLEMPMISIEPADISPAQRAVLKKLPEFDWIVFTSENGVRCFIKEFERTSGSGDLPPEISIAAIGRRTATVSEECGMAPRFVSRFSNAGMFSAELLSLFGNTRPRVLWPTGSLSPGNFEKKLSRFCDIERIDLYRTAMPESINQSVLKHIVEGTYDMIFFFSPSAVKNFLSATRDLQIDTGAIRAACIGPVTRDACAESGITPVFTAPRPDSRTLFESTVSYYRLNEINNGLS